MSLFTKVYMIVAGFGVWTALFLLAIATWLGLGCASPATEWCVDSVDTYVEGDSDWGVTSGVNLRWRPDGRCDRAESN